MTKAEVNAAWRQKQKEQGLCTSHRSAQAVPGKSYCQDCLTEKRLRWMRAAGVGLLEVARAREAWKSFTGRCWCCSSTNPGTKGWVLDHDHETLTFRGILCSSCNLILGYAHDSTKKLGMLMVYLRGGANNG
jgi:Recombination endonuclease VII